MPRLLALEWDGNEARVAMVRTRGTAVLLEHAFNIPLGGREAPPKIDPKAIGKQFAEELAKRGWSKGDVLVAVSRASIEMRFLTTPPAPPDEIPDMVRFQAMRQFTTLGDEWPLDYVTLGTHADGGTNVLAAALSSDLVSQIKSICSAAGLDLKRLVLRPFAAASLIKERAADGRCRMLVDVLSSDADLTVLVGPQVMFPRTAKLPTGDDELVARSLVAEVRRTIIAAQNQLGGRRVEQVIVLGEGRNQVAMRSLLQQELQLEVEVEVVDPLSFVESTEEAKADPPVHAGAFAPLFGMLIDEAAAQQPAIDFLHPRRRPEPPNHRRLYSWLGGSAAAIAVVLLGLIWYQLSALDSKIFALNLELNEQTKLAQKGKPVRDEVARLDRFEAGNVLWLEELRELSREFPPPAEAQVEELNAAVKGNDDPATLSVQGVAAESTTISQIERALRDDRHVVTGTGGREDERATTLRWRFKEEIKILPTEEDLPVQPATAEKPAAKPALKKGGAQ